MSDLNTTESQGDTGANDSTEVTTSIIDSIQDESLKGNETLKDFGDIDSLAKGYLEIKETLPIIPEAYENGEVPESMQFDEKLNAEFQDVAKELGMTQDQYAGLMKFDQERNAALAKQQQEATKKAVAEMQKEYGDKYEENLALAQKVLKVTGSEGLIGRADLGNDTDFMRHLVKIGSMISEDNLETGGVGGSKDNRPKDEAGNPMLKFKM